MRFRLLAFVALALASGCSDDEPGPATTFRFGADTCGGVGCPMSRPTLAGAMVDVSVLTPSRAKPTSVRVNDTVAELATANAGSVCASTGDAPVVVPRVPEASCPAPLAPHDGHGLKVRSKVAGTVVVEVVEEGTVVARGSYEARDATDLAITARGPSEPRPDGSYLLQVGQQLTFTAIAKDAGGQQLLASNGGCTFSWDDTTYVEPTGPSEKEHTVVARSPGKANLTVACGKITKTISVSVSRG